VGDLLVIHLLYYRISLSLLCISLSYASRRHAACPWLSSCLCRLCVNVSLLMMLDEGKWSRHRSALLLAGLCHAMIVARFRRLVLCFMLKTAVSGFVQVLHIYALPYHHKIGCIMLPCFSLFLLNVSVQRSPGFHDTPVSSACDDWDSVLNMSFRVLCMVSHGNFKSTADFNSVRRSVPGFLRAGCGCCMVSNPDRAFS
jgi:hypothetical protein